MAEEQRHFRMTEAATDTEKAIVAATHEFFDLACAIAKRDPAQSRMVVFNAIASAYIQLAAMVSDEEKCADVLRHAIDLLGRGEVLRPRVIN